MKSALVNVLPLEVAELIASQPELVEKLLPDLTKVVASALQRKTHPDVTRDLTGPAAQAVAQIYQTVSDTLADLATGPGMTVALKRLSSPQSNQRVTDNSDLIRQVEELKRTVEALTKPYTYIDQFQVLGLNAKSSLMLLGPNGGRLELKVLNRERTTLFASEVTDDMPVEQPDRLDYKDGTWLEDYQNPTNSEQLSVYVHKFSALGRVQVVGFVSDTAVSKYYAGLPKFADASSFAELGEGLLENFTPHFSLPSETWFLRYITAERQKTSNVVLRNGQGLFALVGPILAEAPMP